MPNVSGGYKGEAKDEDGKSKKDQRNGWTQVAETTKAITLVTKNMQMVTKNAAEVIYVVALINGKQNWAKLAVDVSDGMLAGLAKNAGAEGAEMLGKVFEIGGHIIAGIEIIHSISVILDPTASTDQKIDAAVGGIGAVAGLASGPLGAAIGITWLQVKLLTASYWELRTSIAQYTMNKAIDRMRYASDALNKNLEDLTKTQLLLEKETDPEQRTALQRTIVNRYLPALQGNVEYLYESLPVTVRPIFEEALKRP